MHGDEPYGFAFTCQSVNQSIACSTAKLLSKLCNAGVKRPFRAYIATSE